MTTLIRKTLAALLLALIAVAVTGCETTARPTALTGDDQASPPRHERHATGIESHARDM